MANIFSNALEWAKDHKPVVAVAGIAGVGFLILRARSASAGAAASAAGPGSYLTPNVLAASPTGSDVLSITGGGGDGTGAVGALTGPTTPYGIPPLGSGGSGTGSNPTPSPGPVAQLLAIPERAPNTPLTTGTTSSGTFVAYPSFFQSADQAQQFQNLENQNALSTPAQQAAVLQQAAANPALGSYLKAVQAAGY